MKWSNGGPSNRKWLTVGLLAVLALVVLAFGQPWFPLIVVWCGISIVLAIAGMIGGEGE